MEKVKKVQPGIHDRHEIPEWFFASSEDMRYIHSTKDAAKEEIPNFGLGLSMENFMLKCKGFCNP